MSGPPADDHLDALERRFHDGQPEPDDDPDDLRGTHLWKRLARRGRLPSPEERRPARLFRTPALAILLALGLWGLWSAWPDLAYFASRAPPVDLGRLGAYRTEAAPDGSFVQVEGIALPRRASHSRGGEHELFALVGSRIIVERRGPADPTMAGYGFRYRGQGRLRRSGSDRRWDAVRTALELPLHGEVLIVSDGEVPGSGLRAPAWASFWALVSVASGAALLRRLLT